MRKGLLFFCCAVTGVFLLAGVCFASSVTMKMCAAPYLEDVMEHFAEEVEKESKGQVVVKKLKSDTFNDEVSNIEMVRNSIMEATVVGINKIGVSPSMGFASFPYIFPDQDVAYSFFSSPFMGKVNERMKAETKLRGVGWIVDGFRVLTNSKKPVYRPSDLAGLKIRIPESQVMKDIFASWGIQALPLSWAEVPGAIGMGTLDGQENPYNIILGAKLETMQKYVTPITYNLWCGAILVHSDWYDAQPESVRNVLDVAGKKTLEWKLAKSRTDAEIAKKKIQNAGMTFCEPADGEKDWREAAMKVWPSLYEKSGGKTWIDEVVAEIVKYGK